jgi:hypothetical protein
VASSGAFTTSSSSVIKLGTTVIAALLLVVSIVATGPLERSSCIRLAVRLGITVEIHLDESNPEMGCLLP